MQFSPTCSCHPLLNLHTPRPSFTPLSFMRFNAPTMLPAGGRPATSWAHYTTSCNTQSSAPEDGQNNCPKRVELSGIINKLLLLHLVGCLYYLYFIIFF